MESIIQQASDICDSLITRNNITESNSLYNEMNVHILLKDAHLMRPACKMVKRVFDIITALIILVFVFPWVYLIIACCIKVWIEASSYPRRMACSRYAAIPFRP